MLIVKSGENSITTVLGSCISVCLWDYTLKIGGMNHYLLPFWNGEGLQTPKYGNIAIPLLIERMIGFGCKKENLIAKVFGGAGMLESASGFLNVGERNIALASHILSDEKIPVLSSDTGGQFGRKIMFMVESGEVFVKKISR
ncbi:MAG: chemotaxis protein CheD [Deltaproteobacteria bacterium]|nr:chemotaxis protein CheD [Deltaproteobacteria bacterium]